MIYLDNAATTYPKSENVYKALDKANRELAFNSGRGSYKNARITAQLIERVKSKILKLVNAMESETVIFTASITLAINQILQGIEFCKGDVIYISPYEHNAVVRVVHMLEKRSGILVRELPLKEDTLEIDLEKMQYMFAKENPRCVCCIHVSNVTGYVLPIGEIFDMAKEYNAITILDTAQSLGVIEISNKWEIDFLAFAGHKTLYGPLGIGGFVDYGNCELVEVIVGGTGSESLNLEMPIKSPDKYESSSMNIVAIKGLEVALDEVNLNINREKELLCYLVDRLKKIDKIVLFLPPQDKHVGIVSFMIKGYKSDDIGMILDEDYDIAVRTGYHCAPLIHKWLKDEESLGTIRVGLGKFNNFEEIDRLCDALEDIE